MGCWRRDCCFKKLGDVGAPGGPVKKSLFGFAGGQPFSTEKEPLPPLTQTQRRAAGVVLGVDQFAEQFHQPGLIFAGQGLDGAVMGALDGGAHFVVECPALLR
jgi:hypothetical protein